MRIEEGLYLTVEGSIYTLDKRDSDLAGLCFLASILFAVFIFMGIITLIRICNPDLLSTRICNPFTCTTGMTNSIGLQILMLVAYGLQIRKS